MLSWFPPSSSGSGLATVNRLLMDLTEPVLAPLRRVIPPVGMFDLSFMVRSSACSSSVRIICPLSDDAEFVRRVSIPSGARVATMAPWT